MPERTISAITLALITEQDKVNQKKKVEVNLKKRNKSTKPEKINK